jgi:hypothetical protein
VRHNALLNQAGHAAGCRCFGCAPPVDHRRYPTCECPPDTAEDREAWWARFADDGPGWQRS